MESKLKVKNGGHGVLMSFLLIGGGIMSLQANPGEQPVDVDGEEIDYREKQAERARKILNSALFEAINQGSLEGVMFPIERGVDPTAEDRQGRTPLDFAGHLAEKYPEELERQAIVDFLRNWDSEQHEVDDATVINAAREIWGLHGGFKFVNQTVRNAARPHPKTAVPRTAASGRPGTAGLTRPGTAGATTEAAIQGIPGATGESNEFDNAVRLAKEELEAAQREVEELKTQVRINCNRRNELSRKIDDQWGVYMQLGGGVLRTARLPEDRLRLIRKEIEEKKESIKEKEKTIKSHGGYGHCSCGLIGKVEKEEKELEEKEKELRELGAAIKEYEGIKGEHEKSIKELKLAEERLKAAMAKVEEWNKKSEEAAPKRAEEKRKAEAEAAAKKRAEEAEARRKAEAEAAARKAAEEAAAKRNAEEKPNNQRPVVGSRNVVVISDDESSGDGISVLDMATLLPGVGNVIGPVKAAAEKYQETENILDAVGAGIGDAALSAVGGNLIKTGGKILGKGAKYVGRGLAAPKAAIPKLAFATEVSASKFTPSSAPKAAISPPAPKPAPKPVVQKPPENVVFSKKIGTGGGSGKLTPKPEPPKPERIINTHEDCTKYIDNKVSSGICRKTNKRFKDQPVYEVIKKDGILKKGDRIYKDTTHHEIELMRSDMTTHKGAIDPKTGKIYKEGVPGRNIRSLK